MVDGKPVVNELKPGDIIAEGRGIEHWWFNPSHTETLTMVTVDLANFDGQRPKPPLKVSPDWKEGAWFNLTDEFPHLASMDGLEATSGVLTLQPGEHSAVTNHASRPRFVYLLDGTVTEHRSDSVHPITYSDTASEKGRYSHATGNMWSYWVNDGKKPARLFFYKFDKCRDNCRPTGQAVSE